MREILFRGKTAEDKWVYGFLLKGNRTYIVTTTDMYYTVVSLSHMASIKLVEVIPETVGQYTGLTDKNGKKVFEGDIFCGTFSNWMGENETATAILEDMTDLEMMLNIDHSHEIEVIGNIHDNKELLEVEKQYAIRNGE